VNNAANYCELETCNGVLTSEPQEKCENTLSSSYIVPIDADSIVVQVKDGQFDGDVDCSSIPGGCCGGAGQNNCGGDGVSQVCEIEIDLEDCEEGGPGPQDCTDDNCYDDDCASRECNENDECIITYHPGDVCRPGNSDRSCDVDEVCQTDSAMCPDDIDICYCTDENCYDDDCASRECNDNDECVTTFHPGQVCRPRSKRDPCDVEERCEDQNAKCPDDITFEETGGYALKCGSKIFLCGIPKNALSLQGDNWYLDSKKICNLGSANHLIQLQWPECIQTCPSIACSNYHEVSKYIVGKCEPHYYEDPWLCKSKTYIPEDFEADFVCPLENDLEEETYYYNYKQNRNRAHSYHYYQ